MIHLRRKSVYVDYIVSRMIACMQEYNDSLEESFPSDLKCVYLKGRIDFAMSCLKRAGLPVRVAQRPVILNYNDLKLYHGYVYIKFPANRKRFLNPCMCRHLCLNNDIYWFFDDEGKPARYRDFLCSYRTFKKGV